MYFFGLGSVCTHCTYVLLCFCVAIRACRWLFVHPQRLAWLACLLCVCACVCSCARLLPGELGFLCSVISAEPAEAGRKLHSPPPARKDLFQSRAPLAKWNEIHTHTHPYTDTQRHPYTQFLHKSIFYHIFFIFILVFMMFMSTPSLARLGLDWPLPPRDPVWGMSGGGDDWLTFSWCHFQWC